MALREETTAAYEAAVRMLALREHSESELAGKLRRKFKALSQDAVADVTAELKQQNLLSDARFAESLIRSRVNRGYGPFYIRRELSAKGVDASLAELELEAAEVDWLTLAREQVERRHAEAAQSPAAWAKAARYLQRRGFSGDLVVQAVGERPREGAVED